MCILYMSKVGTEVVAVKWLKSPFHPECIRCCRNAIGIAVVACGSCLGLVV